MERLPRRPRATLTGFLDPHGLANAAATSRAALEDAPRLWRLAALQHFGVVVAEAEARDTVLARWGVESDGLRLQAFPVAKEPLGPTWERVAAAELPMPPPNRSYIKAGRLFGVLLTVSNVSDETVVMRLPDGMWNPAENMLVSAAGARVAFSADAAPIKRRAREAPQPVTLRPGAVTHFVAQLSARWLHGHIDEERIRAAAELGADCPVVLWVGSANLVPVPLHDDELAVRVQFAARDGAFSEPEGRTWAGAFTSGPLPVRLRPQGGPPEARRASMFGVAREGGGGGGRGRGRRESCSVS